MTNAQNSARAEQTMIYLRTQHQLILETLKLKLRQHQIKTSRSQLVQLAITLLGQQPFQAVIKQIQTDQKK